MNGAVGVQKLKPSADGSVLIRQRVTSLWVPSSAYVRVPLQERCWFASDRRLTWAYHIGRRRRTGTRGIFHL